MIYPTGKRQISRLFTETGLGYSTVVWLVLKRMGIKIITQLASVVDAFRFHFGTQVLSEPVWTSNL